MRQVRAVQLTHLGERPADVPAAGPVRGDGIDRTDDHREVAVDTGAYGVQYRHSAGLRSPPGERSADIGRPVRSTGHGVDRNVRAVPDSGRRGAGDPARERQRERERCQPAATVSRGGRRRRAGIHFPGRRLAFRPRQPVDRSHTSPARQIDEGHQPSWAIYSSENLLRVPESVKRRRRCQP